MNATPARIRKNRQGDGAFSEWIVPHSARKEPSRIWIQEKERRPVPETPERAPEPVLSAAEKERLRREHIARRFAEAETKARAGDKRGMRPSRGLIEGLAQAEADRSGVALEDILGRSMKRRIVHARGRVMYRLYTEYCYALVGIGRAFDRHHTTVLSALRTHAALAGSGEFKGRAPGERA